LQAFAFVGEVDLHYLKKHLKEGDFRVYLQAIGHRQKDTRIAIQEVKVSWFYELFFGAL
jgi:hypothetical protein